MTSLASQQVRIVEEVPGVPEDERFFVVGVTPPNFKARNPYPHFATQEGAIAWLKLRGINEYSMEPFDP